MNVDQPWMLLALLGVGAVAAWALWRPGRREVLLPSLAGWLATAGSHSPDRPRRRLSSSWLVLLLGAVLVAVAMAGPAWHRARPGRRFELAVLRSAELAGPAGSDRLARAGQLLAERLTPNDRVRLVLPTQADSPAERWLRPASLSETLGDLPAIPASSGELTLPAPRPGVPRVVFAPAGAPLPTGPGLQAVALPASLPKLLLVSLSARTHLGLTSALARLRNTTGEPQSGALVWLLWRDGQLREVARQPVKLRPGLALPVLQDLPPAGGLGVRLEVAGQAEQSAWLTKGPSRRLGVLLQGRASRWLVKHLAADPLLRAVRTPAEADLAIVGGGATVPSLPCLFVAPSSPPPGFRDGAQWADVSLADADADRDDPLLAGVRPGALAARRVRGWVDVATGANDLKTILSLQGQAIMLRTRPARDGIAGALRAAWLGFDLSAENLAPTTASAVLLANAVRWLGGVDPGEPSWRTHRPIDMPGRADLRPLTGSDSPDPPGPGLYRTSSGRLLAVSPTVLRPGPAAEPLPEAIAKLQLPSAVLSAEPFGLGPWLAVAGGCCWAVGWALRNGPVHTIPRRDTTKGATS